MADDDEDSIKPFYLRDFKKGGKKLGEILHDLPTDELLELITKITVDSPENVFRKEEIDNVTREGLEQVNEVENKYFLGKRGEHKTRKGKAKSIRWGIGHEREQATELIREHA